MMSSIMHRTNDINKYCRCSANEKVLYTKQSTSGNDPSISSKMRFSQYVNLVSSKTCHKRLYKGVVS